MGDAKWAWHAEMHSIRNRFDTFCAVVDTASPVFPDERQQRIAEFVAGRGRARISELAAHFAVTEQTVRKDLRVLQDQGILKRTHGGAIALRPLVDRDLAGREATNQGAKQRIAHACLDLLHEGDSVFLDSGTTVASIARALKATQHTASPRFRNVSILTSALDVAREVADLPTVEHVLVGGQLRSQSGALVGGLALDNLQRFTVDIAFVGASGFSEDGISVATVAEAQIKGAIIERARHVVIPFDASKVGATDFARICDLDAIDTIVLDRKTPGLDELCRAHEIRLIVAPD
jgi:DeoR/GlpR family transcriptional regulator of sugar metabolism